MTRSPNPVPSIRRLARPLIAAALLSGLSGCGYFWGDEDDPLEGTRIPVRQIASATAAVSGSAPLPTPQPVAIWPQDGGGANRVAGHPAGSIAMERLWSVSIGAGSDSESRVTAAPVATADRIYALDAAAQVTAVGADGRVIWRSDLTPEDEDGRDGFGGGLALTGGSLIETLQRRSMAIEPAGCPATR
ncbi:MAG: hypothetical protein AAFW46_18365, partial [Pseudomonadota bacterium]